MSSPRTGDRSQGVERFGGWSLGESTFLVNDAKVVSDAATLGEVETFLEDAEGDLTLEPRRARRWCRAAVAAGRRGIGSMRSCRGGMGCSTATW